MDALIAIITVIIIIRLNGKVVCLTKDDKSWEENHLTGNTISVEHMKEYLKFVVEFERYVYVWSNAMNNANKTLRSIKKQKEESGNIISSAQNSILHIDSEYDDKKAEMQKQRKSGTILKIILILICVGTVIMGAFSVRSELENKSCPLPAFIFLTLLRGFQLFIATIIGPICLWLHKKKKSKYKSIKKQLKELENGNSKKNRIFILQSEITDAENDLKTNTRNEIAVNKHQGEISTALQEAKKNLAQIYSKNILPARYRSLNAAATLLQYLETGRCNTIQGHGGIYDTYEVDLQRGIIINTLSDIRNTLYRIEDTQNRLYNELQQANHTLSSINSNLTDIRSTNEQIAKNSAISAEANRQTAACVRWATWNAWANGY